jgi:serine/threonine protein kinase
MEASEGLVSTKKYRPIIELGRGGMAEVFLAVTLGQGGFTKLVVLKKTLAEYSHEPEFISMFLDEARLAARLSHPNVVQTYEVGQEGSQYFIAMEYLDGQPLNRARGTKKTPMPLPLQLHALCGVLAGLHHAHELCDFDGTPLGVVHRDISPHNVFITYDGQVKVVDFGIAKAAGAATKTQTGAIKGKVSYMPPEQALGKPVDRRADIFAVGVMLWEAVSGLRYWEGTPDAGILFRLSNGDLPSLRQAAPAAPPALIAIADRALAPSPSDRYATAAEMLAALEVYTASQPTRTTASDLSAFLTERFADQRAKIKRVIEAEIRNARSAESERAIPLMPPSSLAPESPATIRPSTNGFASGTPSSSKPTFSSPPTLGSVPAVSEEILAPSSRRIVPPTLQSQPSPLAAQAHQQGSLVKGLVLGAGCAIAALGLVMLLLRRDPPAAAASSLAAAASSPSAASPPPAATPPATTPTAAASTAAPASAAASALAPASAAPLAPTSLPAAKAGPTKGAKAAPTSAPAPAPTQTGRNAGFDDER